MSAYYNEHDRNAAAWLRELIKAGLIAPGDVDERSIEDVTPNDIAGYTQCHFFAGIGVWAYALRQAGWSDDRPVWTGSCPCQPFSAAGKGAGFDDERHLWPAFHHLISQCRPVTVFGEQVASKDGLAWLDLVQSDLEGTGYAVGAVDTCAAGFGAPHIRQRLYWVADAQSQRQQQFQDANASRIFNQATEQAARLQSISGRGSSISTLADAEGAGEQRESGNPASTGSQGNEGVQEYGKFGSISGMANAGNSARQQSEPRSTERGLPKGNRENASVWPGPVNGFWGDADWLRCRDDKWRSVRPGSFPLVNGASARVGRLRGYGNALVGPQAQAFVEAYLEVE